MIIAADSDLIHTHDCPAGGTVQTGFRCGRTGFHSLNQQTSFVGQTEIVGCIAGDVIRLDSEVRPR